MKKELQIGQRIDVFEVLTHGGYNSKILTPGVFRCQHLDFVLEKPLVGLFHPNKVDNHVILELDRECQKVGTLIIKSLKNN